ncbi:hypothetical protein HanIR_Chr02g0081321 [Helianthus annuus]|nr:hypothetical protein HanIR_Chr02g0081321 [Helianthus annuus]
MTWRYRHQRKTLPDQDHHQLLGVRQPCQQVHTQLHQSWYWQRFHCNPPDQSNSPSHQKYYHLPPR